MGWLNEFWSSLLPIKSKKENVIPIHIPIPPEKLESIKEGMRYSRTWVCSTPVHYLANGSVRKSPVKLKITGIKDRENGPSNFKGVFPAFYPIERFRGHSIVPSGELNWNGIAEERGWQVEPIVLCSICLGKK